MSEKQKKLISIAEILLIALITFVLTYSDALFSVDCLLRDNIYQSPRGINNKIKIVAIDDETLRQLGPMGTWSRSVYADALDMLGDYPSVIAMDIMFFGEMDPEGDRRFIETCASHDNLVAPISTLPASIKPTKTAGDTLTTAMWKPLNSPLLTRFAKPDL